MTCEKFNVTIAIPTNDEEKDDYIYVEDDKVWGQVGRFAQKKLNSRKQFPYLCKMVTYRKFGEKTENGSYDGAFGMVQNGMADLVFNPTPAAYINSDSFGITPPIDSEEFLISHSIEEKFDLDDSKLILEFFYLNFMGLIFIVCLFLLFSISIISLFLKFNGFLKNFKLILNSIGELNRSKPLYIIILSISFVIFSFLIELIFLINIKTNKVIVDTNSLLTSEERIFDSDKKLIWNENHLYLEYASRAKEGSFLHKLYKYKNYSPIYKTKDGKEFLVKFCKEGFAFQGTFNTELTNSLAMVYTNVKTFINPNPYYSDGVYFVRSKENNEKTKYIDKITFKDLEHGMNKKMYDEIVSVKLYPELIKESSKIYRSVEEYIKDYDYISQLKLGNYYYLFVVFLMFNFILLAIFLIHHLIIFIQKNQRKIKFSIKNRFSALYN